MNKAVSRWNAAEIALIFAPVFLSAIEAKAQRRAGSDQPGTPSEEIESVLKAHAIERRAHLLADPDLFNTVFATDYHEVNRGRVSRSTAAQRRERFSSYFASVHFLEWEDVRPPLVSIGSQRDWAEIVVEKRVRTIPASGSGAESSVRYAWTERWSRAGSGWVLASVASTERPEPDSLPVPLADRVRALEILRRARQAVGGDRSVINTEMLRFAAECQGPRGSFRTTVASARNGRVLFAQDFPNRPRYRAGISLAGQWEESGGKVVDSLNAVTESVLRAHEVLLLAISPEARYSTPAARADEVVDGRTVNVVRFRDGLGAPVDFLFDPSNGRPLAFRPVNHTGQGARDIVTRFDDWRPAGELTLPRSVTMTQGTDVYRYRITEISTDWIEDRSFRP